VCSQMGDAIRNVSLLRAATRIHVGADTEAVLPASYRDGSLFKVSTGCTPGYLAIEVEGLLEGDTQTFDQCFSGAFLTIDARDLFNPADPPPRVLFDDRCVVWSQT